LMMLATLKIGPSSGLPSTSRWNTSMWPKASPAFSAATTMSGPRSRLPALAATYSETMRSNWSEARLPSSLCAGLPPCSSSSSWRTCWPFQPSGNSSPSDGSLRPPSCAPSRGRRRPCPFLRPRPKKMIAPSSSDIAIAMPMRSRVMSDICKPPSCRAGEARGFGAVHGHQARHARLAHGHAGQLVRGFHGRLVVGDEQELYLFARLADHRGETADVGLVQRRVHLVQQAERRRVEAEDRE